ncbi:hypothetical protein OR16_06974 [Cupriavidus basilensis OR16]|uniref:Uncharacterized protein n=1 Tax=Cupriavidus basilensis OR16 TaxID=1127483 RepID=H1S0Z7_9BURK|nr:hypothetical protein OR16_06974 [Cupriavidus basilensis OR16]
MASALATNNVLAITALRFERARLRAGLLNELIDISSQRLGDPGYSSAAPLRSGIRNSVARISST